MKYNEDVYRRPTSRSIVIAALLCNQISSCLEGGSEFIGNGQFNCMLYWHLKGKFYYSVIETTIVIVSRT